MSVPFKSVSFAAVANIAIANGLKTSIATSASPANYSGVALNGTLAGTTMFPARTISVTTATHAASYNTTNPIVFTGTDPNGATITESLTLTQSGGNETVVGLKGFATVTSIAVPAQNDALGSFTFGVRDLILSELVRAIRVGGSGNLHVSYSDGSTDTLTGVQETLRDCFPTKIWGDGNTTVTNLTLFFGPVGFIKVQQ